MNPNLRYKTNLCRFFKESYLKRLTLPSRSEMPLRSWTARVTFYKRCYLKSLFLKMCLIPLSRITILKGSLISRLFFALTLKRVIVEMVITAVMPMEFKTFKGNPRVSNINLNIKEIRIKIISITKLEIIK